MLDFQFLLVKSQVFCETSPFRKFLQAKRQGEPPSQSHNIGSPFVETVGRPWSAQRVVAPYAHGNVEPEAPVTPRWRLLSLRTEYHVVPRKPVS